MKAVTDKNVSGDGANARREAFDSAVELKSLGDVNIILEGILWENIKCRIEKEHEVFFKSACTIDNSAKDVTDYDIQKAINWIAESESNARKVIILTNNVAIYSHNKGENVRVMTPSDFIYSSNKILELVKKKTFISIDEFLLAVFFL